MRDTNNRDCTSLRQTVGERKAGRGAIRAVLLAAVCGALTLGVAQRATADEDPPGCASAGGNALGGGISAPSLLQDGDRINYTVAVFNPVNACLTDDVSVRFWPPDMTPDDFPGICSSTNGIVLASGLTVEPGQTWKWDVDGSCSFFFPLTDCATGGNPIPALNYTVAHTDEPLVAYRCAQGTAHVGPIDGVAQAQGNFPSTVIHPEIEILKTADIARICEGVETRVNYTYDVHWGTDGDIDLENVVVSDDLCGSVVRQADNPGNDDDILELGENWVYTCNALIREETTNIATVTAQDIFLGRPVEDTDTVTVEVNGNPTCSVDPPFAAICDGDGPVEFCALPSGGRPPYSYEWTTGEITQCITASAAGVYCVVVADDNGCVSEPCCATLEVNGNPICEITHTACPFPVELTADPSGGREPYSYLWNTGETTQTIAVNVNGLYSVTVTDDNGCEGGCKIDLHLDCEVGEGCTPGYWRQVTPPNDQHLVDWLETPYSPFDLFANTDSNGDGTGVFFDDAFSGLELIDVLSQHASAPPGPNQLNNLGRHTIAALLNAAHPDVAYDLTPLEVITMFNDVYPGTITDYNGLKDIFEDFNEQGCPLNGNADADGEGLVGIPDLLVVMGNWGTLWPGDVDQDRIVDLGNLLIVFTWWGS